MGQSPVIAVDVALLLPTDLRAAVTRLNRQLRPPPAGFRFDETHLPHITLVQQFIRSEDIARVRQVVEHEVRGHRALSLTTSTITRERVCSTLGVTLTTDLDALHRRMMACLAPHAIDDGRAEAFWTEGDGPARPTDVEWVTRYREDAALAAFAPHVTLGVGEVDARDQPLRFTATELALCQLGRFCTCRRVLCGWTLTGTGR